MNIPNTEDTSLDCVVSEFISEVPLDVSNKMDSRFNVSSGCIRHRGPRGVEVIFLEASLWETFRQVGTEMIITKKGRRVFPVPSYVISGLDPAKLYNILIKITAIDNAKHKFWNGEWVKCQENAYTIPSPFQERSTCLHPSSPNTGAHWMQEPVIFSRLKISNNVEARSSIVLQSMRKYQMSLVISPLYERQQLGDVVIPQAETQFVAVTQYQNDKITQIKIEHNPFANSFRIKRSYANSEDDALQDEDTLTGESSDDHSDQLALFSRTPGYPPRDWTSGPFPPLPPGCLRADPTAMPWQLPRIEPDLRFQALHGSHIVSTAAPMFPMFSSSTSAFNRVVPPPFMLNMQTAASPLTQIRHLGRSHHEDSVPNAPLLMAQSPMLVDPAEETAHLGHSASHEKSIGVPPPSTKSANKLPSSFDRSKKKAWRDETSQSPPEVSSKCVPKVSCPRPEITLSRKDVWAATQEVVVSEEGRPMYPHLGVTATHLQPGRLYSFCVELLPASPWFYEYEQGEWTPSVDADAVSTLELHRPKWSYQHPDNPRQGRHWEAHGVSFEGLYLATACQGKNKIKVQMRRQYFPVLTISTDGHIWQYPLRAAMFVTVGIDRNIMVRQRELYYQPQEDPPLYLNARAESKSDLRASVGRKQSCPKKTSIAPPESGTFQQHHQSALSGTRSRACEKQTASDAGSCESAVSGGD